MALDALRNDKMIAEITQKHDVRPKQVTDSQRRLLDGLTTPGLSVKDFDAPKKEHSATPSRISRYAVLCALVSSSDEKTIHPRRQQINRTPLES